MNKRILLAGCGDLGERVAKLLRASGDEVWALRRQPPKHAAKDVHWLAADLTDPDTLGGLPKGVTHVVYLAAPDSRDKASYRAIFVDGLSNLIAALDVRKLERVLLVSSSAVYGEHDGDWVDEATPPVPMGFNGAVLLEAERWLAEQPVPSSI